MNAPHIYPVQLDVSQPNTLVISWSDGQKLRYKLSELLAACPCAGCREKRAAPPKPASPFMIISPEEAQPLRLMQMSPVGNYAYSLKFSHGCTQGIYTFEALQKLGVAEATAS